MGARSGRALTDFDTGGTIFANLAADWTVFLDLPPAGFLDYDVWLVNATAGDHTIEWASGVIFGVFAHTLAHYKLRVHSNGAIEKALVASTTYP